MPLRLAYMGTPEFAIPALNALIDAGHTIACVYCQPPRPAGRGHKERLSPVQRTADTLGLAVRTPTTLRAQEEQDAFRALELDAAVVAAYGLILPKQILAAPRLGCLNIHASLLPRWRGAAPIQRAILAGDRQTGITIMQMDEGLDTGAILLAETTAITGDTTAASLHDALAQSGARLITRALDDLDTGRLTPIPQPEDGICYADKLSRAESRIDWTEPAALIERKIRAFTPWPGAWFEIGGVRHKLLGAETADVQGIAGTALDDRLTIACGEGALRLTQLQREGRRPVGRDEFLRGHPVAQGTQLA